MVAQKINEGAIEKIPGVILQAQMISQLLSAALEGRSLIWVWSIWQEIIWIWGWSLTGSLLAYYIRPWFYLAIATPIAIASLYGVCLVVIIHYSAWIPLVPSAIALIISIILIAYCIRNFPRSRVPSRSALPHPNPPRMYWGGNWISFFPPFQGGIKGGNSTCVYTVAL
ncbi:CHASE2 domain-containing protein [Nostoc sp. C117]|uniref:CHASE2 domain-containing protein n=1 Tax=Nostoc sp. C117 TaxID=3349875 RepID=UPI00370D0DA8